MAAIPHGADADSAWIAATTSPDVCVVGGTPVPFDTTALLSNWDPSNPQTNVFIRNHCVYRETDMISTVLGNAGSGVPSGTSLGSGHVLMDPASPPTYVHALNQQVIVDGNSCRINTNAAGGGGAPGQIYTDLNDALGTAGTVETWSGRGLTAAEMATTRTVYRAPNGQFMSRDGLANLPIHERAGAVQRVATPGMGGTVGVIRGASKVLGPVGTAVSAADGYTDQMGRDAANVGLTDLERQQRAATRAGLEAGGGWAGAAAGAWAGAAVGVWAAGWGAIPGAIVGGIAGGWGGGKAGEYAADQVLEPPAPVTRPTGAQRKLWRTGRP